MRESTAIKRLHELAKEWPSTLWLFAADNELHVMRKDKTGKHAITKHGGVDPEYIIDIVKIPSDGGDW